MVLLISPTERDRVLKALQRAVSDAGIDIEVNRSPMSEKRGVDFLWRGNGEWWGVQRKELNDFLASLNDGRLTQERAQMEASVTMPHLILEGRIQTTGDGTVMRGGWGQDIHLSTLRSRLLTLGYEGVHVSYTRDIADTASYIVDTYLWSQKASHSTAKTRPKPKSDWGTLDNRDFQIHMLQGLPDVGPELAEAILDFFGRCPIRLEVTAEDLQQVPGIGPTISRRIVASMKRR